MDNNRTIVLIAGMEFKLTGDESQQYMDSLAEMVNAKVDEVKRTYPMLSTGNCVLLAALNMADELTKLRSDYEALDQRISDLREMPKRSGASAPVKRPFAAKQETGVHKKGHWRNRPPQFMTIDYLARPERFVSVAFFMFNNCGVERITE